MDMTHEFSHSAQLLFDKFKRENGIESNGNYAWKGNWYARGSNELEAVRALCKQLHILCEL